MFVCVWKFGVCLVFVEKKFTLGLFGLLALECLRTLNKVPTSSCPELSEFHASVHPVSNIHDDFLFH